MSILDDPDGQYVVLVNREGRYSLWPAVIPPPAGWTIARPAGPRAASLDVIRELWTDMQPEGLAADRGD